MNNERDVINNIVSVNQTLKKYSHYDRIEEPQCPIVSIQVICDTTGSNDEVAKLYWKELYLNGFQTILEDLQDQLISPQLEVCAEIEDLLFNGIVTPNGQVKQIQSNAIVLL